MEKILLHSCCAPCASASIEKLLNNYEIILFFYNPNIHPETEYSARKDEIKKIAEFYYVELITGKYDPELWFSGVKGLEKEPERGKRCDVCFRIRLENTGLKAKELGIRKFTSTLSISPHKDFDKINNIGQDIASKLDLEFVPENFKKKDGYKKSIELSKKFDLYRQGYCGCVYSKEKK
ncbi:epoxyqueuosine reductase QueH [candidate division KSB1 bacterium]